MERMNRRAIIKGASATVASMVLPTMAAVANTTIIADRNTTPCSLAKANFADTVTEIESHGYKVTLTFVGKEPAGMHISFPDGLHGWPDEYPCFARFGDYVKDHRTNAIAYLTNTGRTHHFAAKL